MTAVTLLIQSSDSNIYVSALQFGGVSARILGMARMGTIRIDTSDALLTETIGVLRDKFHWSGYRLHFAGLELQKLANIVQPTQTFRVVDDPDDDKILECAVEAGSDFIVTQDKDLLRLGSFQGIGILRAVEFLDRQPMR